MTYLESTGPLIGASSPRQSRVVLEHSDLRAADFRRE